MPRSCNVPCTVRCACVLAMCAIFYPRLPASKSAEMRASQRRHPTHFPSRSGRQQETSPSRRSLHGPLLTLSASGISRGRVRLACVADGRERERARARMREREDGMRERLSRWLSDPTYFSWSVGRIGYVRDWGPFLNPKPSSYTLKPKPWQDGLHDWGSFLPRRPHRKL
jgi:hypothetical protein